MLTRVRGFVLLATVVLLVPTAGLARSFSDVPTDSPYAAAFRDLSDAAMVQGYPDGTGRPSATLTRVEALKVLLHTRERYALDLQWFSVNMPPVALYRDTDQSAWYGPYLEVASLAGIASGYPDGTFRPGSSLTVAEAVTLLFRFSGEDSTRTFASAPTLPNRPGGWFSEAVSEAHLKNLLMRGVPLRLESPITRGQFFDLLYRLRTVQRRGEYAYRGPEPLERVVVRVPPLIPVAPPPALPFEAPEEIGPGDLPGSPPVASPPEFAIDIPSLSIAVTVVHPSDPFTKEGILAPLRSGLGHLFSYPGQGGKVMIYGHSSSYAWDVSPYTRIFRRVNQLNPGDRVHVTYDGRRYTYEVTHESVVDASDSSAFDAVEGETEKLILYTCWPPDSIHQRYLVHAQLVESVALR